MSFAFIYWFILLCWILFGSYQTWSAPAPSRWGFGGSLIQFILYVIIGLRLFGFPIHS
jgi:hypothetical protein